MKYVEMNQYLPEKGPSLFFLGLFMKINYNFTKKSLFYLSLKVFYIMEVRIMKSYEARFGGRELSVFHLPFPPLFLVFELCLTYSIGCKL